MDTTLIIPWVFLGLPSTNLPYPRFFITLSSMVFISVPLTIKRLKWFWMTTNHHTKFFYPTKNFTSNWFSLISQTSWWWNWSTMHTFTWVVFTLSFYCFFFCTDNTARTFCFSKKQYCLCTNNIAQTLMSI